MPKKISFQDRFIEFVMTAPAQEVRTLMELGNAVLKNRAIGLGSASGIAQYTPQSPAVRRQRGPGRVAAAQALTAQALAVKAQPTVTMADIADLVIQHLPGDINNAATPDASSKTD